MKRYDVTAMGELLIDFIQYGMSDQGNLVFEANPGGAPCNVLSMLSGLSDSTAFIGKVGNDSFGYMLKDALVEQGIDVAGLRFDDTVHTTLALVHKLENGDRDFSFYRKPGADMCLTVEELKEDLIRDARIFHFGSLSLTDEVVRKATMRALSVAHEAGTTISFDPNLREPLWDSLDTAKEQIAIGMQHCDIMKISDNEITWFTGIEDYEEGAMLLMNRYPNIRLLLLSMGKDGSKAFYRGTGQPGADNTGSVIIVHVPAFIQENTIETTGAGDTFMGSMLHFVLKYGLDEEDSGNTVSMSEIVEEDRVTDKVAGFNEERLYEALSFANAAASIITTRKGALRVMPKREEVERFLKDHR